MSITVRAPAATPARADPTRRTARIAGVLFVITFLTSIPAVFLYAPVLHDHAYVLGVGADTRVTLGAFLEVILVIANIGTAVTLFPITKRQNEAVALGYVASRIVESTIIVAGILSLLTVVTLRHDLAGSAGTDPAAVVTVGRSLVALHNWTFLLGPALCAGFGNGLLLGYLMYRSAFVPRGMALLGLIGGPLVFASGIATLFGVYAQTSRWSLLATLPEIAWEASLGIYLIVKGLPARAHHLRPARRCQPTRARRRCSLTSEPGPGPVPGPAPLAGQEVKISIEAAP